MVAIGGTGTYVHGFLSTSSSKKRLSMTLSVSSTGGDNVEVHFILMKGKLQVDRGSS